MRMVSGSVRRSASFPVSRLGSLLLRRARDRDYSQDDWGSRAKQIHPLFRPSNMAALFWPLPIATPSQLRRLRLIFAFSYRFVITRPPNEFKLLLSDLVYCAIPSNISCNKKDKFYQGSFEFISLASQISETPEASTDKSNLPTADPLDQMTT